MSKKEIAPSPDTEGSGKKRQRDEYDPPWKEMIGDYFAEFLAFFFPEAYADIDWQRSYEALDKELHKIMRDAAIGRRIADKLVKVWLKNGEEQYVLIHVEVQGRKEADFGERMFVYNYRVFDVYRRPSKKAPVVVSFALLADDDDWKPSGFHYGRWGSRLRHGLDSNATPAASEPPAHTEPEEEGQHQEHEHLHGEIGHSCSSSRRNSTRRFFWRPSGVLLSTAGRDPP